MVRFFSKVFQRETEGSECQNTGQEKKVCKKHVSPSNKCLTGFGHCSYM